jgi:hypothetical protein
MASLTPNVKNTLSPRSILPKLHVDTGAYVFRGQFKFTTTETNGKLCVQYPPMGMSLRSCLPKRILDFLC